MKDRGIIFSAPMVQALLDGRKTQTRRLASSPLRTLSPGDRLWVRETCRAAETDDGWDITQYRADGLRREIEDSAAAGEQWGVMACYGRPPQTNQIGKNHEDPIASAYDLGLAFAGRWVPSIHMPRWASRLTLIVQDVRTQPLRSISLADARAEGIERASPGDDLATLGWRDYQGRFDCAINARESFCTLWESLHEKEGERWADNPSVLAITFAVEHRNVDRP